MAVNNDSSDPDHFFGDVAEKIPARQFRRWLADLIDPGRGERSGEPTSSPAVPATSSPSPGGRFLIQNRYQDGGWEDVAGSRYHSRSMAYSEASYMSHNAIVYGMVRVVDTETGCVVVTFAAGSCGEPLP